LADRRTAFPRLSRLFPAGFFATHSLGFLGLFASLLGGTRWGVPVFRGRRVTTPGGRHRPGANGRESRARLAPARGAPDRLRTSRGPTPGPGRAGPSLARPCAARARWFGGVPASPAYRPRPGHAVRAAIAFVLVHADERRGRVDCCACVSCGTPPGQRCPRVTSRAPCRRLGTSRTRNSTRRMSPLSVDRCDACAWPILETPAPELLAPSSTPAPAPPANVWRTLTTLSPTTSFGTSPGRCD
jgi:hypothetical protein